MVRQQTIFHEILWKNTLDTFFFFVKVFIAILFHKNVESYEKIVEILESLEELDDVQNIYTNASLGNIK